MQKLKLRQELQLPSDFQYGLGTCEQNTEQHALPFQSSVMQQLISQAEQQITHGTVQVISEAERVGNDLRKERDREFVLREQLIVLSNRNLSYRSTARRSTCSHQT